MVNRSAGILLHRVQDGTRQVLIGHPGGPFWAKKDDGAWSVIKGEYNDEHPETAARREFREETGIDLPDGTWVELPEIKQKSGKLVTVFAVDADLDISGFASNTFEMEWPPKSGKQQSFPEIDRIEWFSVEDARVKLLPAQVNLLDALGARLDQEPGPV